MAQAQEWAPDQLLVRESLAGSKKFPRSARFSLLRQFVATGVLRSEPSSRKRRLGAAPSAGCQAFRSLNAKGCDSLHAMPDDVLSVEEDQFKDPLGSTMSGRKGAGVGTIPASPTIPSPPPHARRGYGASRPPKSNISVFWLIALGVVFPLVTLGIEFLTHMCAEVFFDPIPSWFYVLLVALVPVSNLLVALTVKSRRPDRLRWLVPLQGAALAVSSAYALLFVPLMPMAAFAIMILGWGLLPLTPSFSLIGGLQGLSKLRTLAKEEGYEMPRVWPAIVATVGVMALSPLHGALTNLALSEMESPDRATAQRGLWLLRTFGSENHLLHACYGNRGNWLRWMDLGPSVNRSSSGASNEETARKAYYQVTGQPYNAVPAPMRKTGARSPGAGSWNFDPGLGGTQVANRVPGLSMTSSRLDGKADVAAGTSYLEWTMVFKNVALNQSEARAQIELPPGAAVSRLTLWIDGQPCEAAFGGRSQVRAAYQEVAVAQRRDPVLVTTSGPNRVLMQCFPVQPNGGEMKVRVGITAPLHLVDGKQSEVLLPRMLEWNFEHDSSMAHELWLESNHPLSLEGKAKGQIIRQRISDSQLQQSPRIIAEHPTAAEIWADDPTDPTFAIRQVIRPQKAKAPRRVIFLVDGSKSMRPHLRALGETFAQLPPESDFAVVFAGDDVEKPWDRVRHASAQEVKAAATWLSERKATGGRENMAALLEAWDLAASTPDSAIIWVHGPQPILLGTAEPLIQRRERDRTPPLLYDFAVEVGSNRVLEQLDGFEGLRPARPGVHPTEGVKQLLSVWNGTTPEWHAERQRVPRPDNFDSVLKTDRHLTRLWGAEEVDRLRLAPEKGSLDQAMKLAMELKLVTPVSGAVVLERAEQYARHGLKPGDPSESPTVPEPTTGALLTLAAGAYAGLRRWRRS